MEIDEHVDIIYNVYKNKAENGEIPTNKKNHLANELNLKKVFKGIPNHKKISKKEIKRKLESLCENNLTLKQYLEKQVKNEFVFVVKIEYSFFKEN